jgi:putative ABC transport system substrate-binding protein
MRRIGALISLPADDPEQLARNTAFEQGLQETGWTVGRNVQIDYRFVAGDVEAALRQATRTLPIVFAAVEDPVGAGYIASLARPGGNTTGFAGGEYSLSGKRLELLRQIDGLYAI